MFAETLHYLSVFQWTNAPTVILTHTSYTATEHYHINLCSRIIQHEGNSWDTGLQDLRKAFFHPWLQPQTQSGTRLYTSLSSYSSAQPNKHRNFSQGANPSLVSLNANTYNTFHCSYTHTHNTFFGGGSQMAWVISMPGVVDFLPTSIV